MYPTIPFAGLSWPITQHAGVISEPIIRGLLNACLLFNGSVPDADAINNYLVSNGILTANYRTDRGRIDAWRDYQQILSEFGLIYSTRVSRTLILTPVAKAFVDGDISFEELITLQILRYQYPNGHKSQLSPSLVQSFNGNFPFESFTEVQASFGILVRPAVVIWETLMGLRAKGELVHLTTDELQCYVVRCLTNSDVPFCVDAIISSRHAEQSLAPLHRARRNMQDWIKLLNNTPLFNINDRGDILYLSQYSIDHEKEIRVICEDLSTPESFWLFSNSGDFKLSWFAFYGNMSLSINLIPAEKEETIKAHASVAPATPMAHKEDEEDGLNVTGFHATPPDVSLHSFNPIHVSSEDQPGRQVVAIYDIRKSQNGRILHDSMVNCIARQCVNKGADVFYDSNTVDLYVQYKSSDFIVEVKSITPSNFIHRLRLAIGQVNQYDYLMPHENPRRLGLAFTASIPSDSWIVPFVTNHMNMDLLYMDSSNLQVRSNSNLALELFGI